MNLTGKALTFCGHRPENLPQEPELMLALEQAISEEIDQAIQTGFTTFLFGGCRGFDLICAEKLLLRKSRAKDTSQLNLIAVLPYERQSIKWRISEQERYFDVLAQCSEVITLYTRYQWNCYFMRSLYMLDYSSRLICYDNGAKGETRNAVAQARIKGLEIINLCKEKVET